MPSGRVSKYSDKEIVALSSLRQQRIVSDQRLDGLKTQVATFGGERGEKTAFQAQALGRINDTKLQLLRIDQDFGTEVGRELLEVQAQLGKFIERRIAAEDELRLSLHRSPAPYTSLPYTRLALS